MTAGADAAAITGTASDRPLVLGRHVRGRPTVVVHANERHQALVGHFCTFGDGVTILVGGLHRTEWVTTYPIRELHGLPGAWRDLPWSRGDVVLEPDVHIGSGALIHSGVRIGAGSVVAPFSNVTRSIPPYSLVSGNLATVTGTRFDADTVHALLDLRWWDWPDERIRAAAPLLRAGDVAALVEVAGG